MLQTDEELKALRERNFERAKEAVLLLGEKWLFHPTKVVKKKKVKKTILEAFAAKSKKK